MTYAAAMWLRASLFGLVCLVPAIVYSAASETQMQADNARFNYKTGVDTYTGHVLIIHGDSRLAADKAITYLNKDHKLQKAVAFGNPAHLWQAATPQQTAFHAYAKQIEFYPAKHLVVLIGEGKLLHDNNTLQAPYITYNIQTQELTSKSSATERTTFILKTHE